MENQELEVKFYIEDLPALEKKVIQLGSKLIQERVLERNLRFDTPEKSLTHQFCVLRLRQDTASHLTFKGPAQDFGGARLRTEIEFEVSDFSKAKSFLEALGYQVSMIYEKYRTMYEYCSVHIAIDELPFGNFVELEGPDALLLRNITNQLHLTWDAQVLLSYTALFERLKSEQQLPFRDLTFENFRDIQVSAQLLHIIGADTSS